MYRADYSFAKANRVFASGDAVVAAKSAQREAITEVMRSSGVDKLSLVEESDFERAIETYYSNLDQSDYSEFTESDTVDSVESALREAKRAVDILDSQNDAPVIKLLNSIFITAMRRNASDVHLEPFADKARVRMRVDGVLLPIAEPPLAIAERMVARVKVLSKLDIAERRLPQDGRLSLRLGNREVDLRVSTIPSMHGERVVMRILEKRSMHLNLDHLGLTAEQMTSLATMLAKPNGILLVTGPTGSGKTTTLYAALQSIASTERNIMTVEDPVEYDLEGISQTQISTKTGYGFAQGLKAILRQDPDVVLVGEIRDFETAEIAVQASLTGHFVLSTLHTNSAAGAITRLADLGVEPFLLSSSLRGVLAQRLVRVLCKQCRSEHDVSDTEGQLLEDLFKHRVERLYKPVGCAECANTGFAGRAGIYEFVEINEELRQLVHDGAGEITIERKIRESTPSLLQFGARLVFAGETTVEELLKVAVE